MSQLRLWAFCVVGGLGMMGCGRTEVVQDIGPASEPVLASLQAMGGVEVWKAPPNIRTEAVLTVYDDKGQSYTNQYRLDMDLCGRRMSVEAPLPGGRLTGTIRLDGGSSVDVIGHRMDPELRSRVVLALESTLYLAGGPANFLYSPQTARSASKDRIAGRSLVRVSVAGESRATAYYFDSVTSMLLHVTSGSDRAGGEGSIATYTYQMLKGGKAFPQEILVTRIGDHVLVGDKPILKVSFDKVRFE